MPALVALEGVVIVLLVVLVAGLLRSHAEILRRLHELGAGEDLSAVPLTAPRRHLGPAPVESVTGVSPEGAAAAYSISASRGHTLLAFLSTGCTTCGPLWKTLGEVETPEGLRTVVVTKGAEAESPSEVRRLAPPGAAVVMSTDAWDAFRVPATPYFVLVNGVSGQVVGEGSARSWSGAFGLMQRGLADAASSRATTARRLADSGEELTRAGIEPGDQSLYSKPEQP